MACMLWSVFTWTFKGILCTCRFLWICPYNAVRFLPKENHTIVEKDCHHKQSIGSDSKMVAAIPGCPDRTATLQKRLTKTEQDILSLKTRIACERASWERRFAELQRKQEELCNHVIFDTGALMRVQPIVDNGDILDESSSKSFNVSRLMLHDRGSDGTSQGSHLYLSTASSATSSCSSASSVRSGRSLGPHRVFVPHSPMDLQLGHRVRIMLPSGRISTGSVRFLGHLQGESELHIGVELQAPDHGVRDGHHKGHCYFDCKPGHGAFVPFHKLLMAWE
uniref:CAP-Gly domain-containing linker protein 2 isoform X2 n=1 Tax=Doryrhamphus excisus TaxID=161450 RepID=UPI0025AE596A|nr:CAP-Gly domain-containing linker protein 2 isoform X2 [Doryrhamphus excisus]